MAPIPNGRVSQISEFGLFFPSIFTGSLNDPFLAMPPIVLIHSHLCVHIPSTSRLDYLITCQNGNMYMTSKTHAHWWTSNTSPRISFTWSPPSLHLMATPTFQLLKPKERERETSLISLFRSHTRTPHFSSLKNLQASLQNTSSLLSLFLPQLPLLILFTIIFLWYYCSHYYFHPCTQV